jgi:hypothetical protein
VVALLGFDDALYEGKGAFIVKNTWDGEDPKKLKSKKNSEKSEEAEEIQEDDEEKQREAFEAFRGKIAPENLEGYYAIPYGFVEDSFFKDLSEFKEKNKNGTLYAHPLPPYESFYEEYQRFESEYPVYFLPYSCNREKALKILKRYSLLPDSSEYENSEKRRESKKSHLIFQTKKIKEATFNAAQISQASEVEKFYNKEEKYQQFYCPSGEIYPSLDQIQAIAHNPFIFPFNPQSQEHWEGFFTELIKLEESSLFMVPFSCHSELLMTKVHDILKYKRYLVEHPDPKWKALAQKQLNFIYDSFIERPKYSGFRFTFVESESEVLDFYANAGKFENKFCKKEDFYPQFHQIKDSDFYKNILLKKDKEIQTKEYWISLFEVFKE